jgi:hypothetical protein
MTFIASITSITSIRTSIAFIPLNFSSAFTGKVLGYSRVSLGVRSPEHGGII